MIMNDSSLSNIRVNSAIKEYGLFTYFRKKAMTTDETACSIRNDNTVLQQVDTFPYLGSLIRRHQMHRFIYNWQKVAALQQTPEDLAEPWHKLFPPRSDS
jgi:hypothetical protein